MTATVKARAQLERTVPELQYLARKGVFTDDEITAIVKKRNDFEHLLNGPGHHPSDYVRYATYETNLGALQTQRAKRLGIKKVRSHGPRAVFNIMERATTRFPGDKSLWLQYIQFCQSESANKRLARAFTSVLRLRPRDWGLWVLAAKHYAESLGDMTTARGYLQRGIRFCADERQLYLQYAKLEMVYLAKMAARRKVLGLDEKEVEPVEEQGDDEIALPKVTLADIEPEDTKGLEHVNEDMLKRLAEAPLLHGAIPIAIFDSAMKQFHNSSQLAEDFFDLTMEFDRFEAIERIQQHILQHLEATATGKAELVACQVKQLLSGVSPVSADYPAALGGGLSVIREADLSETESRRLSEKVVVTLAPVLRKKGLDPAIQTVLRSVISSHARNLEAIGTLLPLLKRLEKQDDNAIVKTIRDIAAESGT